MLLILRISSKKRQSLPMRRYSFYYDDLSRLSEARYTDTVAENTGRYNTSYSYDKHGNLQSLRRNGMQDGGAYGIVDDLYYEYDGNRLCKVRNAAESPCYKGSMHFSDGADEDTEYSYDSDGNLIEDKNKDITCIEYNVLNLPKHVDFKSGKNIDFIYSATGDKLYSSYLLDFPTLHAPALNSLSSDIFAPGKFPPEWSDPVGPSLKDSLNLRDSLITDYGYFLIYGAHRIDYCGDILYEDVKPTPNRILFDGGYVTFTNNKQPVYHFYLRDHQGNVRVVADENGTVEETNHYYPFGALFGECAENNKQRYKYNGKELDRLLSLDWYDYGARWYAPVLARWHAVDPLADKYPDVSPYVYCNNNAVNAVDPDGRKVIIWYKDKHGNDRSFCFTGFNGKKTITIPNNQFVKDFIMAYKYNLRNGGGDNLKAAVINPKYNIYVDDATLYEDRGTEFDSLDKPTVYWESRKGLKTTDGGLQSAATRLEHEFDHAVDNARNHKSHRERSEIYDAQYENKEEKRVIEGSEAKTARANGETIRNDHKGETYNTISPISIRR